MPVVFRSVRRVVASFRRHRRLVFIHVHVCLLLLLLRLLLLKRVIGGRDLDAGGVLFAAIVGRFPLERLPPCRCVAHPPGHRHEHHRLRGVRFALRQISEATAAAAAAFGRRRRRRRIRVVIHFPAAVGPGLAASAVGTLRHPENNSADRFLLPKKPYCILIVFHRLR